MGNIYNWRKLRQDLTGHKFGKLTVLSQAYGRDKKQNVLWNVKCECGKEKVLPTGRLKIAKSCGCRINGKKNNKYTPKESFAKSKYIQYASSAKKRNIIFDIKFEDFEFLLFSNCYYCGIEPSLSRKRTTNLIFYNGIDRLNNDKGYYKENCVSACINCNQAKHRLTESAFLDMVSRIYKHRKLGEYINIEN